MKTYSLIICGLIALGSVSFTGCDDDHCKPRRDPKNCDMKVTYRGPHFCSGVKLQKDDGTWLRAFNLKGNSYKDGEVISVSTTPYKLEFDCQTFAALPPEDLGTPVSITCESAGTVRPDK